MGTVAVSFCAHLLGSQAKNAESLSLSRLLLPQILSETHEAEVSLVQQDATPETIRRKFTLSPKPLQRRCPTPVISHNRKLHTLYADSYNSTRSCAAGTGPARWASTSSRASLRPFRIEGVWVEVLRMIRAFQVLYGGFLSFGWGGVRGYGAVGASGLEDSGLNQLLGLQ